MKESASDPATGPATGRFTIGMVGRITPSKGQHVLLNAISRLKPELRQMTRVLVLGAAAPERPEDVRYQNHLRDLASQQGVQEIINWAGYQLDPTPFYTSMDVLVHPAVYEEAMGLVILEAFERGIPVIASRSGGIPEIVQEGSNGLLFPAGDDEALAQALTLFMQDGSLREHLRAGARASLDQRFSLEAFSVEIRKLVSEEAAA